MCLGGGSKPPKPANPPQLPQQAKAPQALDATQRLEKIKRGSGTLLTGPFGAAIGDVNVAKQRVLGVG